MSAECDIHGVDLHGETFSGLVCPVCESEAEINGLRELLRRALDEFVHHQSWRCAHPDRYPLDEVEPPDCPCGLHQFTLQARAALPSEEEAA